MILETKEDSNCRIKINNVFFELVIILEKNLMLDRVNKTLSFSVISALVLLITFAFPWNIVDIVTPLFVGPLLTALCLTAMLSTAWAAAYAYLYIPFVLENTALLASLTHPNHIVFLCSWGSLVCRLPVIPITLGIEVKE